MSFDAFWNAYPRKVGKQAARRVFATLTLWTPASELLTKVTAFATATATWPADKLHNLPAPVTWLKERYYNHDPATWRWKSTPAGFVAVPPDSTGRCTREGTQENQSATGSAVAGEIAELFPDQQPPAPRQEKRRSVRPSKSKAPDPRHSEIVRRFTEGYAEQFKTRYAVSGRDVATLKRFLKSCQATPDEIADVARRSWLRAASDRFASACKRTATIHGLCTSYNDVRAELSRSPGGCDRTPHGSPAVPADPPLKMIRP